MITRIEINGFKTFRNFAIDFAPLTVIAGLNASGKSNLFDALHLLSRLAGMDLRSAFSEQRGEARELFTQYRNGQSATDMRFSVEMLVHPRVRDNWGGEATIKYTRLRYTLQLSRITNARGLEDIAVQSEELLNLKHQEDQWVKDHLPPETLEIWRPKVSTGRRGKPYIYTEETDRDMVTIKLPQDGKAGGKETPANVVASTVLSSVNSVDFPHVFAAKQEMLSWKFLQLSPEALRLPSQYLAPDQIAENGANLAAALFRIKKQDAYSLREISRQLNHLLPELSKVEVRDDEVGKQFVVEIAGADGRNFSSRVLSEGTLRLLVLCVLMFDDSHQSLICFEEPENGVHPARIREMVSLLKSLTIDFDEQGAALRQMIVNTHSPILLGEMIRFHDDKQVKVWFSKLATQTMILEDGGKDQIQATKMLQVSSESQVQAINTEGKLAIHEAQEFLSSLPTATELISQP
jgi:predicted ATPase